MILRLPAIASESRELGEQGKLYGEQDDGLQEPQ